jgi:hypothetical protein
MTASFHILFNSLFIKSQLGIATDYGVEGRISIPVRGPTSLYSIGTRVYFSEGKAARS